MTHIHAYKQDAIPEEFKSWEYVETKPSKESNFVKVIFQKDLSTLNRVGLFLGALGATAAALLLLPLAFSDYRDAVKSLWDSVFSGKVIKKISVEGSQNIVDQLMRSRLLTIPDALKPPTTNSTHVANEFISLSDPSRRHESIHFKGQVVPLEFIKVLDQTKAHEAPVFCGIHALKNATIALGIPQGFFTKEAFENKDVYQAIKTPIQAKSGQEGDSSIAPLAEFWRELSDPSLTDRYDTSETLRAAHQVARTANPSLTMLTYEGELHIQNGQLIIDEVVEPGNVLGDETTLPHIASLVELSEKLQTQKPFHHAFVMGSHGHWVTVLLERDQNGSVKWYGLDSWQNNPFRFPTHILVLDKILAQPQEFAKKAFHNLIGQDLQRKRSWFTDQGVVKDPQDQTRLMQPANQNKYISRIAYAAEFFERAGWTKESHPDEFAAVRALATFYNTHGADQDPRVQKTLRTV